MLRRFPLSAKILAWFFLNLALLALVGALVVQHQLRFGLDSLLAGPPNERIRSVAELIVQELNESVRSEWDAVLARFEKAYAVRFYLFSDSAVQLAGESISLPEKVRERLTPRGGGARPMRMEGDTPPPDRPPPREGGPPPGGPLGERGGPPRRGPFGPPESPRPPAVIGLVRAGEPARYWVLVRVPGIRAPRTGPATLLLSSDTLKAGGLLVDFTPALWIGAGVLALSALFWLPLVRGITRSIAALQAATARIAEGRFETRVKDQRRDELGALAASVNSMAERLAGLVHGQRRFLSDVAHELCAPLSRLQMALGILEDRAAPADRDRLQDVREEVDHMAGLVNELLSFSRASLGSSRLKLGAVELRGIIEKTARREGGDDVEVIVDCEPGLAAQADADLLGRALGNLLRNAVRYATHAGPITVRGAAEDDAVTVTVSDRGPGVPEEALAQLFDPFFRVDTSRTRETGGVGLGLTIAKTCVEACRGSITARNVKPSGLEVTIRLPRAASAATVQAAYSDQRQAPTAAAPASL